MSTLLGCIADDFTGATDLAGLLARSGMRVSLRLGVPETAPGSDTAAFEVVALKCRTAAVDEARQQAMAACDWLRAAGASRFFWKYCSTFDSTADGNIGPVAETLLDQLAVSQTIYCPAFPENGRFVFMGNLFVNDLPLAESPMKDHPLTPMRDSNLARLLAPQVTRKVGLADHRTVAQGPAALRRQLDDMAGQDIAHVVVDAVSDADLEAVAQACQEMTLLTGGSAVAMPLPRLYVDAGLLSAAEQQPVVPRLPDGAIVLAGSCSAMTRQQVARYADTAPSLRIDPVELAEHGARDALAWLAGQSPDSSPLIYATAAPDQIQAAQDKLGASAAGELVEQAMAELAVAAFERGVRRFVVAGGETSGAVARALGIAQLDIGAEIAPGVPWTYGSRDGQPLAVALKSGNFGQPDFFAEALAVAGTA